MVALAPVDGPRDYRLVHGLTPALMGAMQTRHRAGVAMLHSPRITGLGAAANHLGPARHGLPPPSGKSPAVEYRIGIESRGESAGELSRLYSGRTRGGGAHRRRPADRCRCPADMRRPHATAKHPGRVFPASSNVANGFSDDPPLAPIRRRSWCPIATDNARERELGIALIIAASIHGFP